MNSPTFQYWDTILSIELLGLIFVRAHREQNYVEVLKAIALWFFALNYQNYARLIPVHIRDRQTLPRSFAWSLKSVATGLILIYADRSGT